MAKRKKKSIAALMNDAATLLQKIVRMKAADENGYCQCVTCPTINHWKEMDGGAFYLKDEDYSQAFRGKYPRAVQKMQWIPRWELGPLHNLYDRYVWKGLR